MPHRLSQVTDGFVFVYIATLGLGLLIVFYEPITLQSGDFRANQLRRGSNLERVEDIRALMHADCRRKKIIFIFRDLLRFFVHLTLKITHSHQL